MEKEKEVLQKLAALNESISYEFKDDGTSPGVLFSSLKDGSVYGSVVRYVGAGKKVVVNTRGKDHSEVINDLAKKFVATLTQVKKNPTDVLRGLVD